MRKVIELLANAFSYGEIDLLADHLLSDCKYSSDYAQRHITSAEQILNNMKKVYENVLASNDDCSYSHKIIELNTVLKEGLTIDDLRGDSFGDVCEYGILLYQYGEKFPAAVVYVKIMPSGKISEINLSRNEKYFNVDFYGVDKIKDSERDIPYTVKPMTSHDRQVKEMQGYFSGQHIDYEELDDAEVYVWRQADKYFKEWLESVGYHVIESAIFDECIGYKCVRRGYCYTIYMFAFGKGNKQLIDGERCKKYLSYEFSEGTVLVSHLNVMRIGTGDSVKYKVGFHTGADNTKIELWKPCEIAGKDVLLFYPCRELDEITEKLIVALNDSNLDLLEHITAEKNPYFDGYDNTGYCLNSAYFSSLNMTCKKYGKMKLGYMSFNNIIYSSVPYIDGYGWFDFSVDNTQKIVRVSSYKFEDDEKYELTDFIAANEKISYEVETPAIIALEVFSPIATERFGLKITFSDGKKKKYVLPIPLEEEKQEAISYRNHVFSDGIWKSAEIVNSRKARVNSFPECGQGIAFKNGFSLSALKCYEDSADYSEPVLLNETVYENDAFTLTKQWEWDAKSIYEDAETGVLKVSLNGGAFNWGGISTIASPEGIRSTLEFRYLSDFRNGVAAISVAKSGCGYINAEREIVIPPIYDSAKRFHDGFAEVKLGEKEYLVDTNGNMTNLSAGSLGTKYEEIGDFSEGLCKVSTLKLRMMDLAYHSDDSDVAGIWGFINEKGEEVIKPQYIYAYDFQDGLALVAKGEWTRDEKWNNKYNKGRYWTETELWGAIDSSGNEVIPCIFDEINIYYEDSSVFKAHYGGWKDGKWGIIDRKGNWVVEPIFESLGYEYFDGMFDYYVEDSDEDVPMGIYDIKQKKPILVPNYSDISFMENGLIKVEVFDETLGRNITKIIDREGKEKFPSKYTSIYGSSAPYEVSIYKDGKRYYGLIDEDGKEILPCKYESTFSGIHVEEQRIVVKHNDMEMVYDFEDNVIIPPIYNEVTGFRNPLLIVGLDDEAGVRKYGLVTQYGKEVLTPCYERISWCKDGGIICVGEHGCTFLRYHSK